MYGCIVYCAGQWGSGTLLTRSFEIQCGLCGLQRIPEDDALNFCKSWIVWMASSSWPAADRVVVSINDVNLWKIYISVGHRP